jgi:hypothetical protein|tara:strand:+ start:12686 stop:12949 length:264 start_codon:yes stop_codon:yes gene_type:complete
MVDDDAKLILISEFIEQKLRKEKELEFYQDELIKLTKKISMLSREVDLTNSIISLIKSDNVYDFREKWIQQEEKKKLLEQSKIHDTE